MKPWKTVYITTQGAVVRARKGAFEVLAKEEVIQRILSKDVNQIIAVGNITFTSGAIAECLKNGIDLVFTDYSGRFRGRLIGPLSANALLRMRQSILFSQEAFVTELARRHVYGKLNNCVKLLIKNNYRLKSEKIASAVRQIKKLAESLSDRKELSEIRGVEGKASAVYFSVFGEMLKNPNFKFTVRSKRPPLDEINALLSLGYTLMFGRLEGLVYTVGLDPYIGSLHELESGKPSLVLDILEEFRFAVDALVIKLVNKKILTPQDFEHKPGDDPPVVLTRDGFKKFVQYFNDALEEEYVHHDNKTYPLKEIMLNQARLMANHVMGAKEYMPFLI